MAKKNNRAPHVPSSFGNRIQDKCSKADLIEIVWDLMCRSEFDETSAYANPGLVGDRVLEIQMAIKECRIDESYNDK